MPSEVDDTRARILGEASELFREVGLAGFSMRKLAARLDLTATALYRHFEDKEQLLASVCAEGFSRFAETLWKALEGPDPIERLRRTNRQYLDFAERFPNHYRIMFMTQVDLLGWDRIPEENKKRAKGTFQFLVDRVAECVAAGALGDGDLRALSGSIWAHCHGLVSLRLDGQFGDLDEAAFRRFYTQSCDFHLAGLGAERSSP